MKGEFRRAEWRPVADEPPSILRWVPRVLWETPSLILVFAAFLVALGWVFHTNELIGGAALTVLCGMILPYRSPRPIDDLPTLPLPPGSYPVGMTIRLRNVALGTDDAIASFVEGWLHVEGRRTSFSVRAADVRARISFSDGSIVLDLPEKQSVRIEPALLVSQVRALTPTHRSQNAAYDEFAEFRGAAKRWIANRADPAGTAILPPRRVHPAAYARKFVRAAILIPTGVAAILTLLHGPRLPMTPFLVITLWILILIAVLLTVASWSMLRRVDERPPEASSTQSDSP